MTTLDLEEILKAGVLPDELPVEVFMLAVADSIRAARKDAFDLATGFVHDTTDLQGTVYNLDTISWLRHCASLEQVPDSELIAVVLTKSELFFVADDLKADISKPGNAKLAAEAAAMDERERDAALQADLDAIDELRYREYSASW